MIPNEIILALLIVGIASLAASIYLFLKSRGRKITPETRKPGVRYEYRQLEQAEQVQPETPVNKWKPAPRTGFRTPREWK